MRDPYFMFIAMACYPADSLDPLPSTHQLSADSSRRLYGQFFGGAESEGLNLLHGF